METKDRHSSTELILASSSGWKADLLKRLRLPFTTQDSQVDEKARLGEEPILLARRLAVAKARAVDAITPGQIIIGSDQVCHLDGKVVAKPDNLAEASEQLWAFSGQRVEFITAICLIKGKSIFSDTSYTQVHFRQLDTAQIDAYLTQDPLAVGCAGACRAEDLGITLCHRIMSDDPTALIGLPLIALTDLLRQVGIFLPHRQTRCDQAK